MTKRDEVAAAERLAKAADGTFTIPAEIYNDVCTLVRHVLATVAADESTLSGLLEWAENRYQDEVAMRPDVNSFKPVLHKAWSQVIEKLRASLNVAMEKEARQQIEDESRHAADEQTVAAEQGRWQEAIYKLLTDAVGDEESIDGAGCDSGDPLDFTLAEISQALNYFKDKGEVAADDGEAITEEWLLSVGFKHERGELVLDRIVVLDWMPGCLPALFLGTEEITDWPKRSTVRQLARLLGIALPPIAPKSRSVLRREAAMRREEPPEFSKPSGQEEARPVNGLYKLLLERSQEIKNSGQEECK